MSDPYEFVPPFFSPLTHDEHATLGRIAILWGQIDMILDQLLQIAIGLSGRQLLSLMGEKPIGAKLSMLSNHIDNLKPDRARDLVRQFWDRANNTKTKRNRCFHGVWGFRATRGQNVTAAASHFQAGNDPVRVEQLGPLERELCATARVGINALVALGRFKAEHVQGCNRLFNGPDDDPPAWLQEWKEQHPLDDGSLDRRHKLGQLPYLEKPL